MNLVIEKIKKAIEETNKFFSFFLFIPLYFIGLGLSKLLYIIFVRKERTEGWKAAERLKRSIKYYDDML